MQAERLYDVCKAIVDDYKFIINILDGLIRECSRNDKEKVDKLLKNLIKNTDNLKTEKLSISRKRILERFGYNIFGKKLVESIYTILTKETTILNQAVPQLNNILSKIKAVNNDAQNLANLLEKYHIKKEWAEDQIEVELIYPSEIIEQNLDNFQNEIKEINRVIQDFTEISTLSRKPAKILGISSSNLEIYISCDIETVKNLLECVKNILEILYMSKQITMMESLDLKAFITSKDILLSKIKDAFIEIKQKLISFYRGDEGRKQELANILDKDISYLKERIEQGLEIDISSLPNTEEAKKLIATRKEINEVKDSLRQLTGEKLLKLPSSQNSLKED